MFKFINRNLIANTRKFAGMSSQLNNKRFSPSNYPSQMETKCKIPDKNHLLWIDCEMTGLNIEKDRLLEIAAIITDNNLNELDRLGPLVLECDKETLDSMNEWCINNHNKTGLTAKCLKSKLTVEDVDEQLSNMLNKHSIKGAILAGNSISFDSLFIRKYLNKTNNLMHYRLLDVSTIKILKE